MKTIQPSTGLRLSALASFLSGLLLIIGWTLNINRDSLVGAFLVLFGYVFAVFAIIGIYAIQYKKINSIGFFGFVCTIIACTLFTPWLFLDIARISEAIPNFNWSSVQENGSTKIIGIIGGVCFLIGFFLIGISSIKASVLRKWPSYLIIIASLMPLIYTWLPIGKLLPRIGGLALIGFSIEIIRNLKNKA